jgi:peptidoglycan/LPS O-acetylase OafA/YrhL
MRAAPTVSKTYMEVCSNNVTAETVAEDQHPKPERNLTGGFFHRFDSPSDRNRLPSMEGIRGMAVLLVFLVHYYWLFKFLLAASPISSAIGRTLAEIGQAGVDVFFVLSGYLIYAAALKPNLSYSRFLKRRIHRIYPTFLVVLAFYLVISYLAPERSRIPSEIGPAAVYLLQNIALLPGLFPIVPIITVAWSLSYEFAYYLFTPALTFLTGMRTWSSRQRIAFITGLASLYVVAAGLGWFPHPRMAVFAGGMLLYEFGKGSTKLRPLGEAFATVAFIAALIIGGMLFETEGMLMNGAIQQTVRAVVLGVGSTLFIYYAIQFNGILYRMFSWTPLRYWGNISYSYYLVHGLILHAMVPLMPNRQDPVIYWAMLPVAVGVTIVGSAMLYLAVERPLSLRTQSAPAIRSAAAG